MKYKSIIHVVLIAFYAVVTVAHAAAPGPLFHMQVNNQSSYLIPSDNQVHFQNAITSNLQGQPVANPSQLSPGTTDIYIGEVAKSCVNCWFWGSYGFTIQTDVSGSVGCMFAAECAGTQFVQGYGFVCNGTLSDNGTTALNTSTQYQATCIVGTVNQPSAQNNYIGTIPITINISPIAKGEKK